MTPGEASDLRRRFVAFAGAEQAAKFAAQLAANAQKKRLAFWQERVWSDFAREAGCDVGAEDAALAALFAAADAADAPPAPTPVGPGQGLAAADPALRRAAVLALRQRPDSAARLVPLVADPDAGVRMAAAMALAGLGGKQEKVAKSMVDLLAHGEAGPRAMALLVLRRVGGPKHAPAVRAQLADPDAQVRAYGVRALATLDPGAAGDLVERLEDAAPEVREAAGDALPACPPGPDGLRRVLRSLGSSEPDARRLAVPLALAWGGTEHLDAVLALGHDPDARVRLAVLDAVRASAATIGAGLSGLSHLAADPSPEVRERAAFVLELPARTEAAARAHEAARREQALRRWRGAVAALADPARSGAVKLDAEPLRPPGGWEALRAKLAPVVRPCWYPRLEPRDGATTDAKLGGTPWLGREPWPVCPAARCKRPLGAPGAPVPGCAGGADRGGGPDARPPRGPGHEGRHGVGVPVPAAPGAARVLVGRVLTAAPLAVSQGRVPVSRGRRRCLELSGKPDLHAFMSSTTHVLEPLLDPLAGQARATASTDDEPVAGDRALPVGPSPPGRPGCRSAA